MNFLGTTTGGDLLSYLATGVQATGVQVYPLMAMAGVPVAFVIAYYVVRFIRGAVGGTGYYHGVPGGGKMERYDDQELGRELYNIQEKGMTDIRHE